MTATINTIHSTLFWEVPTLVNGEISTSSGNTIIPGGRDKAQAHWDTYFAPHGYRLLNIKCDAEKHDIATAQAEVELHLVDGLHGFSDYDVVGHPRVHRVCVGNNLRKGDIFNVYGPPGVKRGARWLGDIEQSLCDYLKVPSVRIVAEPEAAPSIDRSLVPLCG